MRKNSKAGRRRDPLPKNFATLQEFWEFWDSHSTSDYEDLMDNVSAEVSLGSSKFYYPVAKDLIPQLKSRARQQGVSIETLINLWLREKMMHDESKKAVRVRR
jgi:hypothetical protein